MMNTFRFDIAAIIVCLAILNNIYRKNKIVTRVLITFYILVGTILLSTIFDLFDVLIENNTIIVSRNIMLWNHELYLLFFACNSYFLYFCLVYISRGNRLPRLINAAWFTLTIFVTELLILLNPVTNHIFRIDDSGAIIKEKLYFILFADSGIYLFLIFVRLIRYRSKFSLKQLFITITFVLFSLIAAIFQQFYPEIKIMNFVISVSSFFIYIAFENPADYDDVEYGILNRTAFTVIVRRLLEKRREIEILTVQLDNYNMLKDKIGEKKLAVLSTDIINQVSKYVERKNIFRFSRGKLSILFFKEDKLRKDKIQKVVNILLGHIFFMDYQLNLDIKMNLVYCPEDANKIEDVIDLIENSLTNDYAISEKRKEVLRVNKTILEKRKREKKIIDILQNAIENNDFEIIYQPIFSIKENKFNSAVALLRLKNMELGFISPQEFIPLAEQNGMMLTIGTSVIKNVCKFISENRIWEKGIEYVHINLSIIQCMQERLSEQVFSIMDSYNLDYDLIRFDISEFSTTVSKDVLFNNMEVMEKKKIQFSLDAFGTGFTNINSMANYPFSMVKISRTMIWNSMENEKAKTILARSIVMMKELGLEVIAEGIESYNQADELISMNCDYLLGYFYSYPLSPKDFINFISDKF